MLIVCPKCFTQYLISDEIKLSAQQKFHCSACGEYFLQPTETKEEKTQFSPVVALPEVLTEPVKTPKSDSLSESMAQNETPVNIDGESLLPPVPSFDILTQEEPKPQPLDCVPEEFKPVEAKSHGAFMTLIWLLIGAGICLTAYFQKDVLLETVDNFILGQLDHSYQPQNDAEESLKEDLAKMKKSISSTVSTIVPELDAPIEEKPLIIQEEVVVEAKPVIENPIETKPVEEKVIDNASQSALIEEKPLSSDENASKPQDETPIIDMPAELSQMTQALTEPQPVQPTPLKDILVVRDIAYEVGLNEAQTERLLIKGNIVNTELKDLTLPQTKAVVYDEQDNIVARKRIIFNQSEIAGNSTLSFETSVVPAPKSISQIEVVFDE